MIFITENDLRNKDKDGILNKFRVNENERLTPGARQFLIDRGIDMYGKSNSLSNVEKEKVDNKLYNKKLKNKFKSLGAEILIIAEEFKSDGTDLLNSLLWEYKKINLLIKYLNEVDMNNWGEINKQTKEKSQQCCEIPCIVEIDETYILHSKSNVIVQLYKLQCYMTELIDELDTLVDDNDLKELCELELHNMTMDLGQIICKIVGGK